MAHHGIDRLILLGKLSFQGCDLLPQLFLNSSYSESHTHQDESTNIKLLGVAYKNWMVRNTASSLILLFVHMHQRKDIAAMSSLSITELFQMFLEGCRLQVARGHPLAGWRAPLRTVLPRGAGA